MMSSEREDEVADRIIKERETDSKNVTDLEAANTMLNTYYQGSVNNAIDNLIKCIIVAESKNNLAELKEYEQTLIFLRENKDKFNK